MQEAADQNMLVLRVPPGIEVHEVGVALEHLLGEYRKKAEQAGKRGLFYAWADAMSGTFRCSFCEAMQFESLPFRCPTSRAASLAEIASFTTELSAAAIPWSELAEVEWSNGDDSPVFELRVFATPIGSP
ncbi:MAG: hypothetical protein ACOZQL_34725 [Myxococcota bacterium]